MANKNRNLGAAKAAKNDEFYTQYADIEREMNAYLEYDENVFRNKTVLLPCDDPEWSNFTKYFAQNFQRFGLKKLISTSYAIESKNIDLNWEPTLFETENPNYDVDKTKTHGKIFILDGDSNGSGRIDINDLKWEYLEGDGDFRSEEVKKLRDEADITITNCPFSLFREYIKWAMQPGKQFIVLGRTSAVHYADVFNYIKNGEIWIGSGFNLSMVFKTPYENSLESNRKYVKSKGYNPDDNYVKTPAIAWYTNIEHGKRHQPLQLMSWKDNVKYSKHEEVKGFGYAKYDNYDAIEIPYVDAIPSDYDGIMGVPDTYLGKFCPEQFELLGATQRGCHDSVPDTKKYDDYWECRPDGRKTGSTGGKTNENANLERNDGIHNYFINTSGKIIQSTYSRIFIRKKQ